MSDNCNEKTPGSDIVSQPSIRETNFDTGNFNMSIQNMQQPLSQLGEAALKLVLLGLALIQLAAKTKVPRKGSRGYKDATTSVEVVRQLWTNDPYGNIGAATGVASGFVVIDVDGELGMQTLASLEAQHGPLPDTVTVITPGKIQNGKHTGQGRHYYFRLPAGISLDSRNGIALNVDLKAERGYIVLPPSIHPDGGFYQFAEGKAFGEIEIAELPPQLVEFLVAATAPKQSAVNPDKPNADSEEIPTPQNTVVIKNPDERMRTRMAAYLFKCEAAEEGNVGHVQLLKVANAFVHGFCLDVRTAADFAWAHYNSRCIPPWSDKERADFDRKFFEAAAKPPRKQRGWLLNGTEWDVSDDIDTTAGKIILDPKQTKPSAEKFIQMYYTLDGTQILYFHNDEYLEYRDNKYQPVKVARLRREAYAFLDKAYVQTATPDGIVYKPYITRKPEVDHFMDALKSAAFLDSNVSAPCWLGDGPAPARDPLMIVFGKTRNLDLTTMKTIPASPRWFNYFSLGFDYEDRFDSSVSQCPRWDAFLEQLFGDDKDSKQTLLMYIGLLLTSITKYQKILLIVGPKRSGKGTLARVIKHLIGEINFAGLTTDGLGNRFGLQDLIGKPVCIISDARFGGQNLSVLTERILTISGEDTLTIERKFLSSLTMRLPTRFVFLTNEIPRLPDSAGALAGRFIVLKLTRSFFGAEDLELESKLLEELPGIFVQAVAALQDLLKLGCFAQPLAASDEVELLEDLTSPVLRFVKEYCEIGDAVANSWTSTAALYKAWQKWCQEEGYQCVGTCSSFCRNLKAAVSGLTRQRASQEGARIWVYKGIRLLPEALAYQGLG